MKDRTAVHRNWEELSSLLDKGIATIPQLLVHQAHQFGDRVFYRKKMLGIWQGYTWTDVVEQIKSFAMGMASLGIRRGDVVAIVAENQPELFWSEYAAQAMGAKVVCLEPDLTPSQMEYRLTHSGSVMAVCEDQEQVDKILELEQKLPEIHTIVYWDERGMWKYHHSKLMTLQQAEDKGRAYLEKNPHAFEEALAAGRGDDVAVVSYTSGVTGLPKGCLITHANLFDMVFRLVDPASLKPFSRYLSYISPARLTEQVFGITMALFCPLTVYFPEEPETAQENMREIGTEAIVLSARQWESLSSNVDANMLGAGKIRRAMFRAAMAVGRRVNLSRLEGQNVQLLWRFLYALADTLLLHKLRANLGLHAARLAISEGSAIAPEVFRFFHTVGIKLRNSFGTIETGLLTLHQGESYDPETVGTWLPVHSRFGPPLQYSFTGDGELLVRGGSGFVGYYTDREATATQCSNGWFRTGDAARLTEKDELVYVDRLRDLRKLSTGDSYSPQFIESRLRSSPFIKDALIVGDESSPFVAALVNVDVITTGLWAEQRKISYTTLADLSQESGVLELIKAEIDKVNHLLPEKSRVRAFINLPKELDPDEDELTRNRKLRRRFLEERYGQFISAIYGLEKEVKVEVPVRYQDGRSGVVNATVYVKTLVEEKGKQ